MYLILQVADNTRGKSRWTRHSLLGRNPEYDPTTPTTERLDSSQPLKELLVHPSDF